MTHSHVLALPAEILSGFETQYTQPGPNVSMRCLVRGKPEPEVTWMHDGVKLSFDLENSKRSMSSFRLKNGSLSIELTLTRITINDGGTYACMARNRFGSMSREARLEVYGENS